MSSIQRLAPAVNAFTFPVSNEVLLEIKKAYKYHIEPFLNLPENRNIFTEGLSRDGCFGQGDQRYYYTNTLLETTRSMIWFSIDNMETLLQFKRFFDRTGLAKYIKEHGLVDFDRDIRLYCGFIMVSYETIEESWHVDYYEGSNAYTFICPIEIQPDHGGLLYENSCGEIERYAYRVGEGIMFGDGFFHTTQPYSFGGQPRVQLSLTFGTDKYQYWDILSQTIGKQSRFMVLPCGHILKSVTSCGCIYEQLPAYAESQAALDWVSQFTRIIRMMLIRHSPWAKTLWVATSMDSDLNGCYLKILPPTRKQEALISSRLSVCFPSAIPEVLAYDVERGLLLMKDHGGEALNPDSVAHARDLLRAWANIQAVAKSNSKLLELLPSYNPQSALNAFLHCLNPDKTPLNHPLKIGTYAKDFIGEKVALFFWEHLICYQDRVWALLESCQQLPVTLLHGDLQFSNAARLPNGQMVIYDWGDALAGPVGISISNPLMFRRLGTILKLLPILSKMDDAGQWTDEAAFIHSTDGSYTALTTVLGSNGCYFQLLLIYIDRLVEQGYASRQQLLAGLPGSFLAGALRWLMSWAMEVHYSDSLKVVAAQWWRESLQELLAYLSSDPNQPYESLKEFISLPDTGYKQVSNIKLIRGSDKIELKPNQGEPIEICYISAEVWTLMEQTQSAQKIIDKLIDKYPDSDPAKIKSYILHVLIMLLDYDLICESV